MPGRRQALTRGGKTLGSCEFRRHGHGHVYDYGSSCGALRRVYPQQLLVADLIDALRAAGGQIRFATTPASRACAARLCCHPRGSELVSPRVDDLACGQRRRHTDDAVLLMPDEPT